MSRFMPVSCGGVFGPKAALTACLMTASAALCPAGDTVAPLPLMVKFWSDEVELTGAAPDDRTADAIRRAVAAAKLRRGICDRLYIDPGRAPLGLPPAGEMAGLLSEISLSTEDGSLTVTSDQLIVSGLTDSQVTHAAFEARLKLLAAHYGGRRAINRICIVAGDELDLPHPARPRPALNPLPLALAPFELADSAYGPEPPDAGIAAAVGEIAPAILFPSVEAGGKAIEPPPFEELAPIGFSANTYLVRSDQFARIDSAIDKIRALPESAGKIVLLGYPDQPGRYDYNDWLGQSRAKAVQRFLLEAGVPGRRLTIEVPATLKTSPNLQKVRILIPRHPPASAPVADSASASPAVPDPM